MVYKTDNKWYDVFQASVLLGTSWQNVDQHRQKGHVGATFHTNIGRNGKWLFTIEDLQEFVDSKYFVSHDGCKLPKEKDNNNV